MELITRRTGIAEKGKSDVRVKLIPDLPILNPAPIKIGYRLIKIQNRQI